MRQWLWHLNRTPARIAIKRLLRLGASRQVAKRRALARRLPSDPRLETIAESFRREGYAFLNGAVDPARLQDLLLAGDTMLEGARFDAREQVGSKPFWTRLLEEHMQDGTLPTDSPFVRFALQPGAIGVLARALGEIPYLDYVLLTLSVGREADLSYSQLWHKDYDDLRTIKLFVYLTDVKDQDDGPFTLIPAGPSRRFGFSVHSHRRDDEVLRHVKPEQVVSMLAPKSTVFMVETSRCLHMGSRAAVGHQRLLYTATFITVPRMYPEPAARFRLLGTEDEIEKAVLLPRLT